MIVAANVPPAVRRYLEELELELKQHPGIAPEEALSDAREYLTSTLDAWGRSGEGPREEDLYDQLVSAMGTPAAVAQHYASQEGPFRPKNGYAPGWRICCTGCGRSAPLAAIGGIRIGARSWHKYTLGWCRECRRLRFLRIIKDLDATNLTQRLGLQQTPEELRRSMHRPWAVIGLILLMTFAPLLLFGTLGVVFWYLGR